MNEGTYVPTLGRYIVLERTEQRVKRIYFSRDSPAQPSRIAEKIIDYLEGRATCPKVELDTSACTQFQEMIYALVQEIPRGKTMTYGEVAKRAKRPGAARAVGRAMALNPFAVLVPCHRVVAKNGLGGYFWGREMKKRLLGIEQEKRDICDSSPADVL
jgi:O-6-methylguanine DNA methyltransferase